MTTRTLLEVENLSTWFPTSRGMLHAVDDVSFTLDTGKTLCVVGESGSGKSVLARSVMNLLPRTALRPTGRVASKASIYAACLESRSATCGGQTSRWSSRTR